MTTTLDLETVRGYLAEAVAEKGADYVYLIDGSGTGDCNYLTYCDGAPTGPSCLVGHVLVKAGVPMDLIAKAEGQNAEYALRTVGVDVTEGMACALNQAQSAQDAWDTWGKAVEEFESSLLRCPA